MRIVVFLLLSFISTMAFSSIDYRQFQQLNMLVNQSYFNIEDREIGNRPLRSSITKKMVLDSIGVESHVFLVKRMIRGVDAGIYAINIVNFNGNKYIYDIETNNPFRLEDRLDTFQPMYYINVREEGVVGFVKTNTFDVSMIDQLSVSDADAASINRINTIKEGEMSRINRILTNFNVF